MLTPENLEFTPEGPRSALYGDRYFGPIGALEQARSVFLKGCDIPSAWQKKKCFSILETGFGMGFNFLATWDAWKKDPNRPDQLHFLSIECHPITLSQLARVHASEPHLAAIGRALRMNLPLPIRGCHRLEFEQGKVCLTLAYGEDALALHMLSGIVDAIYLDGFSPERNPELWSEAVFKLLFERSKVGTKLATWCAASEIRKRLEQVGFEVQQGPSLSPWHETTRARCVFNPSTLDASTLSAEALSNDEKKVIVLGSGLAGTAISERLIQRGWQVILIDAANGPGLAASGNTSGVIRPLVSRDDNPSSQFTRAALLYAIQRWERFQPSPSPAWHPTGVLQIARDQDQFQQWIAMFNTTPVPSEWIQLLSREEAQKRSGHSLKQGGLLFPLAGWAQPRLLCEQTLSSLSKNLLSNWNQTIHSLKQENHKYRGWLALDHEGKEIARAPQVVITSGAGPHIEAMPFNDFLPSSLRPLQRIRGEVTHFSLQPKQELDLVICGEGYICPSADGNWSVGATYDEINTLETSEKGILENTTKLQELLSINVSQHEIQGGRASYRSVASDRLPMIGADPIYNGLWHCRAFASRGLAWHALAAELLVAQMNQEPLPLSKHLAKAVSPDRKSLRSRIVA